MDRSIQDEVKEQASAFDFSGKRVLVTGGAGFLGSWLSNTLSLAGGRVVCLDNLSTGALKYLDRRVKRIVADVETLSLTGKYDYIFHMASRASPEEYQLHPVETLTANSIGTMKALELAKKSEAVIVFASTSEVYGDAEVVPTPESYWGKVNPTGVRSCYDEGKRFGEAICMAYHRQRKTRVRIARIFNSYGPAMRHDGAYGRVISRFISQALSGQDVTIDGDGKQTRSFCYATDTVRGLLKLASSPDIDGEVFNIGNTLEMAIGEVARTIIRKTESKSRIVHLQAKADDPRRRCPDISKASRMLRWGPTVEFDEGLSRTIDWLRSVLSSTSRI